MPFNIFTKDLQDGMKGRHICKGQKQKEELIETKSINGKKTQFKIVLENCARILFSYNKYNVLQQGRINQMHRYRNRETWLGSRALGKN